MPAADEDFELDAHSRALPKSTWTEEEDAQLALVVQTKGAKNWSVISSYIPGRTGKQCRERYKNHLDPNLRKGPFTTEEDQVIVWLVESEGAKWALIARQLVGRTDNAIKNRYNSSLRRAHEEGRLKVTQPEYQTALSRVQTSQDTAPTVHTTYSTPHTLSPGHSIPTTPPDRRQTARPGRRAKQQSKRMRDDSTDEDEAKWTEGSTHGDAFPSKKRVRLSPPLSSSGRERSHTQELVFSAALALVEMRDID